MKEARGEFSWQRLARQASAVQLAASSCSRVLQVLNEEGRTWHAVQAATRATRLEPDWADAWMTLARCQVRVAPSVQSVISSALQPSSLQPFAMRTTCTNRSPYARELVHAVVWVFQVASHTRSARGRAGIRAVPGKTGSVAKPVSTSGAEPGS